MLSQHQVISEQEHSATFIRWDNHHLTLYSCKCGELKMYVTKLTI